MVQKPTRITESTETLIDIIATNNSLNLIDNDVIPTSIGDHDMVGCSGVLAGGAGGPRPPQLAILGGRKNEKGAPIPRRILKVGGKKRI